jgi:integrator complex subunit 4
MVSDLSISVRTEAAGLLGSFATVSPSFLDQTLDKKLMSNLRKKKSAHERNRDAFSTGEWSSGKKWADDAPQEGLCPEQINLMDIGACGAFVHGLEDEFLEVRMATLQSLQQLSKAFPHFAHQSLDFLIDMFNDEIEEIRLKAIQVLSEVGLESVVLRDDQTQIILSAFEEHSSEIREALYQMLGNCKLESEESLKSSINVLLENLRKHPEDRMWILSTLKNLGSSHADFVSLLVNDLLGIHPFLELPEPSIEDPSYISLLILSLNAAAQNRKITSQLEHYTSRHYSYLRHAHPDLVPFLSDYEKDNLITRKRKLSGDDASTSSRDFLCDVFKRLRRTIESKGISIQTAVIELSIRDLTRLGETEQAVASACDFLIQYLNCQLSIRKILANSNWINALLLSPLQSSIFRSSLQKILVTTFTLSHKFHGIHPFQSTLIQQTRVKALALQLVAIIHGSNASALSLCDAFLEELQHLRLSLKACGIRADTLTESMMKQISLLDEPKPGSVARVLQPLFLASESMIQFSDLSQMACDETIDSLVCMTVSSAEIVEPQQRSDFVIRFTSGLVLSIKFHANLKNISDVKLVRIKVCL